MIDMDFRADRYGTEDFWMEEQMTPLGLSRRIGGKWKMAVEGVEFNKSGRSNISLFQYNYDNLKAVFRTEMKSDITDCVRFCELMANLRKIGYPEVDCSPEMYQEYVTKDDYDEKDFRGTAFPHFDFEGNSLDVRMNSHSHADWKSIEEEEKEIRDKIAVPSVLFSGLTGCILGYYMVQMGRRIEGEPFAIACMGFCGALMGGISSEINVSRFAEPRVLKRAENLGDYIGKCKKGCERLQGVKLGEEESKGHQKVLRKLDSIYKRAYKSAINAENLQGLVVCVDRKDGDRDKIFQTLADVIGIEDREKSGSEQIEGDSYVIDGKEVKRDGKVIRIKSA